MAPLDRITHDPTVMGGEPCIRGLRVTVGTVAGLVASGHPIAEIVKLYPYLEEGDVRAALEYAAWRVEEIAVPLARS
jgi:uncharacterized protein (DUF433 family)